MNIKLREILDFAGNWDIFEKPKKREIPESELSLPSIGTIPQNSPIPSYGKFETSIASERRNQRLPVETSPLPIISQVP